MASFRKGKGDDDFAGFADEMVWRAAGATGSSRAQLMEAFSMSPLRRM